MSDNRVQKLLFSEYCDFEDMVLIESPFAQTTKDGKGIRQVHLGLTPSKLILATDVLPPVEYVSFKYSPGIDPEIETFELIAIYPVESVNLSIYRTKKNQSLKARFCNNRVLYFELGGSKNRAMFWNLWCERIKFLCPDYSGSSRSETSVGTSTTSSSLYLLDRKIVTRNGVKQLWCTFGSEPLDSSSLVKHISSQLNHQSKWTDKYAYLGTCFENGTYTPVIETPSVEAFVKVSKSSKAAVSSKKSEILSSMEVNDLRIGDSIQINRFGDGIEEGCHTGLFLTVDDYIAPRRYSQHMNDSILVPSISDFICYDHLAETAVLAWEFFRVSDPQKYKIKHRRRYGFVPQPNLYHGFGSISISKGDKYSLQLKRVVSSVCLLNSKEHVFRPSTTNNELTASISQQFLASDYKKEGNNITNAEKMPATLYWTPCYRYRPQSAKSRYQQRLTYLQSTTKYHESLKKKRKKKAQKNIFFKKSYQNKLHKIVETDEESKDGCLCPKQRKKLGFIYSLFPSSPVSKTLKLDTDDTHLRSLKLNLTLDKDQSIWDFDSTALAQHLTMLDKELFLRISSLELDTLLWQQSSKNTPNIRAVITFSERISSLFALEIIKTQNIKNRARLMARLINVASKCHKISNFQSCRSVLSGLQSPAVYRLRETWAYVRKKHGSKYKTFECLCKFYRDTRLLIYQKTFYMVALSPPFMPYMDDIFSKLLGKVPDYRLPFSYSLSRTSSLLTTKTCTSIGNKQEAPKCPLIWSKLLKLFTSSDIKDATVKTKEVRKRYTSQRKKVKFKGLYEYYQPLDIYEDCRKENIEIAKEFLERCQLGAMNYNFKMDQSVTNYLLKARYQEDMENFSLSLSIEPPRIYYDQNFNKL
ncbi:uncharacterized protein LOC114334472 [Diabrotica virgifera virgifera]|uniref:Ras-GEF domain-containing protein n=1 Tax=Diabrotica virgifera virgifera TaxID=50390 RepID=A0ABM5IS50_DIAVI|nr:uncharacterized protein LOC114334472 [Diabrotica virgifera virgifera]